MHGNPVRTRDLPGRIAVEAPSPRDTASLMVSRTKGPGMSTPLVCAWCSSPLTHTAGMTVLCPHCDRRCERLACTRCLHASRTSTDRR